MVLNIVGIGPGTFVFRQKSLPKGLVRMVIKINIFSKCCPVGEFFGVGQNCESNNQPRLAQPLTQSNTNVHTEIYTIPNREP